MSFSNIIFGVDFIHVSGVDSVNLCLAQGLQRLGYNCQIITFGGKENGSTEDYQGIPIKGIHCLPKWFRVFFLRGRDWVFCFNWNRTKPSFKLNKIKWRKSCLEEDILAPKIKRAHLRLYCFYERFRGNILKRY